MTLKVRILQFLTTFTQLTARLENFLRGWLLTLGIKEGLLECAIVCVKSEVILIHNEQIGKKPTFFKCIVKMHKVVLGPYAYIL